MRTMLIRAGTAPIRKLLDKEIRQLRLEVDELQRKKDSSWPGCNKLNFLARAAPARAYPLLGNLHCLNFLLGLVVSSCG